MTSEGLGEIFEGDFVEICSAKISAHVDGGKGDTVKRVQTGSEDPHQRERK